MCWLKLLKKRSVCWFNFKVITFVKDMRKIITILMILATFIGCASSSSLKKQDDKITIEYAAYTRGFSLETKATKVSISGYTRGRKESAVNKSTQSEDWRSLIDDLDKIGVDKLTQLQPPSKKHQFDGAMAASLTVTVGDKSYRTPTFDHGEPPAEIAGLVKKLITLGGIEQ